MTCASPGNVMTRSGEMTLYSGFTETTPAPRSNAAGRRFLLVREAGQDAAGLRHAVRGGTDYPLCDSTLRIVMRIEPFGPGVDGHGLRTCQRCAAMAEPNSELP
ncbi:hypothetical protein AB0878_48460 [Amycolatopsis sp. NPDC047767]|uniref:hypothetical protein n=1 Tax=Amycolatopsis sp. NPDC047767 TaxID=3156765 RepID=UPI0034545D58